MRFHKKKRCYILIRKVKIFLLIRFVLLLTLFKKDKLHVIYKSLICLINTNLLDKPLKEIQKQSM